MTEGYELYQTVGGGNDRESEDIKKMAEGRNEI
jgi:hypothetical protein